MGSILSKAYTIKIQNFEGPFDLLFHLIEKDKIDIYDIPINEVADQYMDYLFRMHELDMDIASEFLVMAATFYILNQGFFSLNLSQTLKTK